MVGGDKSGTARYASWDGYVVEMKVFLGQYLRDHRLRDRSLEFVGGPARNIALSEGFVCLRVLAYDLAFPVSNGYALSLEVGGHDNCGN